MTKQASCTKKSTRNHCSNADGSVAYALSAGESSDAYTWDFNPHNLPGIGESLADHELYDEPPMLDKERHELTRALHHLRRISTSANSPLLSVLAQNASENIHKILILYGIVVC